MLQGKVNSSLHYLVIKTWSDNFSLAGVTLDLEALFATTGKYVLHIYSQEESTCRGDVRPEKTGWRGGRE